MFSRAREPQPGQPAHSLLSITSSRLECGLYLCMCWLRLELEALSGNLQCCLPGRV